MRPWRRDRIDKDPPEGSWEPQPLRIQPPPPEWVEEQERRKREREDERDGERGVWILEL
jgi:hypothetical protein